MNINIIKANEEVFKLSCKYKDFKGMGTTLTGLLYTSVGVITFNVGDSRVYGFADNKMFKLTVDHTLVNEMLQKGEITYEESLVHPKRHYLVKAIGVWDSILADIHQVAKMDQYLVCSDGLSSYVDEEDIKKLLLTGSLDAFLDCLDFAPEGVLGIVKTLAVSLPVNDVAKRDAILEKLNFNVTKAIEIQNTKFDGGDEDTTNSTSKPQRRVTQIPTAPTVPQRRVSIPTQE